MDVRRLGQQWQCQWNFLELHAACGRAAAKPDNEPKINVSIYYSLIKSDGFPITRAAAAVSAATVPKPNPYPASQT